MFDRIRGRIAYLIAPTKKAGTTAKKTRMAYRMYNSARPGRGNTYATSMSSADAELQTSLRMMRTKCRAIIRDAGYGKRAKVIIQNNIVGGGVGMQAQVKTTRGDLNQAINDEIEAAWETWAEAPNCHTGGALHFSDMERMAMGQVFETGEIFLRLHFRKFGASDVPLALEIIEPERVVDEFQPSPQAAGAKVRMGVETDEFHRPIAYWIRKIHPGEIRYSPGETDVIERVPAAEIMHLRVIDRWPQTRGEPWMHTAVNKLDDIDGYTEAELIAARGAASYMATIESEEGIGTPSETGAEIVLEPGTVQELDPGEKLNFVSPNRPNANIDPFMRFMLREIAAGTGISYEALSRDYSQSNYSSSRLALIDDRDLFRTLQSWWIRAFRQPLHRIWLQQAVFSGAVKKIGEGAFLTEPAKFTAVRFKPRGWTWVDPTKEVEAYKEAVKAGFTTTSEVIALTGGGRDIEDVLTERRRELDLAKAQKLVFDTDPDLLKEKEKPPAPTMAKPKPEQASEDNLAAAEGGQGNGKKSY